MFSTSLTVNVSLFKFRMHSLYLQATFIFGCSSDCRKYPTASKLIAFFFFFQPKKVKKKWFFFFLNERIDWNRQRGYFSKATRKCLLFDFRQEIIKLWIFMFSSGKGDISIQTINVTKHVRWTFPQLKFQPWSISGTHDYLNVCTEQLCSVLNLLFCLLLKF